MTAAGFIGVSWLAWAAVAAVASALFTVIQIPEQTPHTTGLTYLILRWAHSITWLLLALSFLIRGLAPRLTGLADVVGVTALGAYLAFRRTMHHTQVHALWRRGRGRPRAFRLRYRARAVGKRFAGYVGGAATGRGHSFVVGDGLYIAFRDRGRARTRFRACWSGPTQHCFGARRTGKRGHWRRFFTAAPSGVGTYRVTWYVPGRPVARWSFYNGLGD